MLDTQLSCEVGDLIGEVVEKSGRPYDEVEAAFFKVAIYPDGTKKFLMMKPDGILSSKPNHQNYAWLEEALQAIFKEGNIEDIYITEPI
jgi:hypothetical protein